MTRAMPVFYQIRNLVCYYASFAGTCTCNNEFRPAGIFYGGTLGLVELTEKIPPDISGTG